MKLVKASGKCISLSTDITCHHHGLKLYDMAHGHSQSLVQPSWFGGRKSPGGVQRWSPGEGLGAKPPEARYIQIICNCQVLFYAGLLLSLSSSSPTPLQNNFGSAQIPRPNTAGTVGTCPPVPTHGYASRPTCWKSLPSSLKSSLFSPAQFSQETENCFFELVHARVHSS